MPSPLSFQSSEEFRKKLIVRNLQPYKVNGLYNSNGFRPSSEIVLRDEGVYDSPDDLIGTDLFAQSLYPLNAYGAEGGYRVVNNVTGLNNTKSNLGEYDYQDATLPESSLPYQNQIPTKNKYSSDQYLLTELDYIQLKPEFETYWSPISFVPSTYTPANILLSDDPAGSDGLLSQDSFIASLGASFLRKLLKDRAAQETAKELFGAQTLDETLGNPFLTQNTLSNTNQTNNKNWGITRPENQIDANAIFVQKLQGTYIPVSPIPGDYFDEDMVQKRPTSISQIFGAFNDGDTVSSAIRAILSNSRTPSELFLQNTGFGQKSQLFFNLDYNQYKPAYSRGILNDIANAASNVLTDLFNGPDGAPSGFYVGSKRNDPSQINSPSGDRPVLYQGMESEALVYGPDRLAQAYENPTSDERAEVRLASNGLSLTDGGGIDGGLVWSSPKYKNAGFFAAQGGDQGSPDPNYNQVSGQIERDLSTNKNFKNGSILDFTQRLVNSTPNGAKRLTHVGNAINNLSKVFNDGYKEITKGSRVIKYEGTNGQYRGVEYGRLFTKDTPYYTFADLQKTDGITTSGRKFVNSVLDNTFNLNIAPINGVDSTNIINNQAKKYMLSIENLAWRTSNRPGFQVSDLPFCERGPNGGRIMWFPPYDLKFNENTSPNFQDNEFLGRPEPIYTYRSTKRTGSISFKIVVDYPSILDVIIQKELGRESNRLRLNEIVDSFMAGCLKFDIYELARRFTTLSTNDIINFQNILTNPNVTTGQITEVGNNVVQTNQGGGGDKGTGPGAGNNKSQSSSQNNTPNFDEFKNLTLFFPPNPTLPVGPYVEYYNIYNTSINLYGDDQSKNFFNNVVTYNYNKFEQDLTEKLKLYFDQNPAANVKITFDDAQPNEIGPVTGFTAEQKVDSITASLSTMFSEELQNRQLQLVLGTTQSSVIPLGQPQGTSQGGNATSTYGPYNCTSDDPTTNLQISRIACRSISIKNIEIDNSPENQQEVPSKENTETNNNVNPTPVSPVSRPILERIREGISKKLVRELLSECSYFEIIKESNPFIYDTIRDKIKYFNPAFHSTTPEGLNARLTFLNQCTRPGDTIPVIGTDGKPKYNNAVNTAFGAPPVLVLRVGDFYNTKIIPTSLAITYDQLLDINPEGIGVQPMIANVTLGFNFVGGSGLANAIDTLQNALSFNYYANTEIYDERAEATESTSTRDNDLVKQILSDRNDGQSSSSQNVQNNKQNAGGETIGQKITPGDSGDITYQRLMDENLANSQVYINSLINKSIEITNNYNLGVFTIVSEQMRFNKGKIREFTTPKDLEIYGKSNSYQGDVDKFFSKLISGVKNENLKYLKELKSQNSKFKPKVVNDVRDKIIDYLNNVKSELLSNLTSALNEITQSQVNLVTNFAKTDYIDSLNDGYIDTKGGTIVYSLSSTTEVTQPATGTNTLLELVNDYEKLAKDLNSFFNDYKSKIRINLNDYPTPTGQNQVIQNETDQLFYIFMSNIISDTNKRSEFVSNITRENENEKNSSSVTLPDFSTNYWNNVSNSYQQYKVFDKNKLNPLTENPNYSKFEPYTPGKERKFTYSLNNNPTDNQKNRLKNLYKDGNSNVNDRTYNGKNTFN